MSHPADSAEVVEPIRWAITELTSLAQQVDPYMARPGLYVIHFANGDAWVGKTIDLHAPFSAMRRRWPEDIEAVEYIPALLHEAAHAEETVVATLVEHGSRVRNALLVGMAPSPVLFDRTIDPVGQTGWIIGEMLLLDPADRAALAIHRSSGDDYDLDQIMAYGALAESDSFQGAFLAAATFLDVAVPAADQTEDRWWSLAVLPDGAGDAGVDQPGDEAGTVRRLVSVRVGGTEVFAVVEAAAEGRTRAVGYLHLAADTDLPRRMRDQVARVTVDGGDVGPVEVLRIPVESPEEAVLLLLDEPTVLLGVRWLVLDLLRRGSGALRDDHNVPMADAIFTYMEAASIPLDADEDDADEYLADEGAGDVGGEDGPGRDDHA